MSSVDGQLLQASNGAIFDSDVRITILAGVEIKLCDIMDDILNKINILDVKCALSRGIPCPMHIIKLLMGVEELSNARSVSSIGQQGGRVNLTMVQCHYCERASNALMNFIRGPEVNTYLVNELLWIHANPNATDLNGCTTLHLAFGQGILQRFAALLTLALNKSRRRRSF